MDKRIDMKHLANLAPCAVSRQRGFTLIEVLIAALVLSIGLLGLAGLQAVSVKMNQGSYLRTQATNLAYEITDAMRANPSNSDDYLDTFSNVTCDLEYVRTGSIAAADIAEWQNRLACLLPTGSGSIAQNGNIFTITVTWDESRQEGSATTESFSFETQL
jgi:type IV pilus assembly protein PilV